MCFRVSNSTIQTAKRDIICFKKMTLPANNTVSLYSYIKAFKYTLGYHYSTDSFPRCVYFADSLYGEGFHSYTSKSVIKKYILNKKEGIKQSYKQFIAVQCRIPKGARYLKNIKDKEYISSNLIIDKIITK